MTRMRRILLYAPYAIVLAFGAWCLISLHRDLEKLSFAPVLRSWHLVVIAAVLSLLNYALRIARWRVYLARLGHRLGSRFSMLTFSAGFAYTLSPGKVGELVRARYYLPLGIPVSDSAAAFSTERLMDVLAMVVLAALILTAYPRYEGFIAGAAGLAIVALTLLAVLPWLRIRDALKATARIPEKLRRALLGIASSLGSVRTLLRPRALAGGFLLGLLAWGLEGIGLAVLCSLFDSTHIEPALSVGIYGLASLVGGLSFLPGGLGSTEAVMTAMLAGRGFSLSEALVVTLVCRLVTLWLAVAIGWLAVLGLRQRPKVESWQ